MSREAPKSPKDEWREVITQHELPDHVMEDLEYVRFTEPDQLSNIERGMLHPDADKFSADEISTYRQIYPYRDVLLMERPAGGR